MTTHNSDKKAKTVPQVHGECILRKKHVELLDGGLTDAHRRNLEAAGKYPKRFIIIPGGKAVGWLQSDIKAWIEERAASRGAGA